MPFADITGHGQIIEVLRRSVRCGKTAHTYIFEGISGIGRRKCALALIQAVFCNSFADDACGVCSSCRKIAGGNHADIHFIEPLPDKRDISIDQLRELQRELSLRPYEAPRKACIIEPAERMNLNGANSMLKTLEEPPGNAIIILITENSDMLLPTIRSRSQLIRFSPLSPENISCLLEKSGLSSTDALLRAGMAEGSMQRAGELDDDGLINRRNAVLSRLEQLDPGRIKSVFESTEELSGNRDETLETLNIMMLFFRDLVYIAAGHRDAVAATLRPSLENFSARLTLDKALQMMTDTVETRRSVQRNANTKLAMDCLFIKLADNLA